MVKSQLFQRMISQSLKKSSYVLWVPEVGDRILVMTGRPGRIRQDISICMELPHHLSNRDNKVGLGVMIWFSWQTMRIEDLYAMLCCAAYHRPSRSRDEYYPGSTVYTPAALVSRSRKPSLIHHEPR